MERAIVIVSLVLCLAVLGSAQVSKSFTFGTTLSAESVSPCGVNIYTTTLSTSDNPQASYFQIDVIDTTIAPASSNIAYVFATYDDIDGVSQYIFASTGVSPISFRNYFRLTANCGVGPGTVNVSVVGYSSISATYSFVPTKITIPVTDLGSFDLSNLQNPLTGSASNAKISSSSLQYNVQDFAEYHFVVNPTDNIAELRFRFESTPIVPFTINRRTLASTYGSCSASNGLTTLTSTSVGEWTYSAVDAYSFVDLTTGTTVCDLSGDWYIGFDLSLSPTNISVSVWASQWMALTLTQNGTSMISGVQSATLDDFATTGYYTISTSSPAGQRLTIRIDDVENTNEVSAYLYDGAPGCSATIATQDISAAGNLVIEDCQIPSTAYVILSQGTQLLASQPVRAEIQAILDKPSVTPIAVPDGGEYDWAGQVEVGKSTTYSFDVSKLSNPDFTVVDLIVYVDVADDEIEVSLSPIGPVSTGSDCYADPFELAAVGYPFGSGVNFNIAYTCTTYESFGWQQTCYFQIPSCLLTEYTTWYMTIVGYATNSERNAFYGVPISYSASLEVRKPVDLIPGTADAVQTGAVANGFYDFYRIPASYFQQHKEVDVYLSDISDSHSGLAVFWNYGALAGTCPCYSFASAYNGGYDYGYSNGQGVGYETVFTYDPCLVDDPITQDMYFSVYNYGYSYGQQAGYNIRVNLVESDITAINYGAALGVGEHLLTDFNATADEFFYPISIKGLNKATTYAYITVFRSPENYNDELVATLYSKVGECSSDFVYVDYSALELVYPTNEYVIPSSGLGYATFEIPPCVYDPTADYHLSIYNSNYRTPVKVVVTVMDARDLAAGKTLMNGVPMTGEVSTFMAATYRYTPTQATESTALVVKVYADFDQLDAPVGSGSGYFYIYGLSPNLASTNGAIPSLDLCTEYSDIVVIQQCDSPNDCTFIINECDLDKVPMQFMVVSNFHLKYAAPLRYTIVAEEVETITSLTPNMPSSVVIQPTQSHYFSYLAQQLDAGEYVVFEIENIQLSISADGDQNAPFDNYNPANDVYDVYLTTENPVGNCPCSTSRITSCSGGWPGQGYQCSIIVPACDYNIGQVYYIVVRTTDYTGNNFNDLGFEVTARIMGSIGSPLSSTPTGGSVRYNDVINYALGVTPSTGQSVMVQVSNVVQGSINVFYGDGIQTPALTGSAARSDSSSCVAPTAQCSNIAEGSECVFYIQPCFLSSNLYIAVQAAGEMQAMFEISASVQSPSAAQISTVSNTVDNLATLLAGSTMYYTVTVSASDVAAGTWLSVLAYPSYLVTVSITSASSSTCSSVGTASGNSVVVSACELAAGTYIIGVVSSVDTPLTLRVYKQTTFTALSASLNTQYNIQIGAATSVQFTTPNVASQLLDISINVSPSPYTLQWFLGEVNVPCVTSTAYYENGGEYVLTPEYQRYGGISLSSISPCCLKPGIVYQLYFVNYPALTDPTAVQQITLTIGSNVYGVTSGGLTGSLTSYSLNAGQFNMHSYTSSPTPADDKLRILTVDGYNGIFSGAVYWDTNAPAGSGCYNTIGSANLYTNANPQTNVMFYPEMYCGEPAPAYFSVYSSVNATYRISYVEQPLYTDFALTGTSQNVNVPPGVTIHRRLVAQSNSQYYSVSVNISVPALQNTVFVAINTGELAGPGSHAQFGACGLNTGYSNSATVYAGTSQVLTVYLSCVTDQQEIYFSVTSQGYDSVNTSVAIAAYLTTVPSPSVITLSTNNPSSSSSSSSAQIFTYTVSQSQVAFPQIPSLNFRIRTLTGTYWSADIYYGTTCGSSISPILLATCNNYGGDSCDFSGTLPPAPEATMAGCGVRAGTYTVVVTPTFGSVSVEVTPIFSAPTAQQLTFDQTLTNEQILANSYKYYYFQVTPSVMQLGSDINVQVSRDSCGPSVTFTLYNYNRDGCPTSFSQVDSFTETVVSSCNAIQEYYSDSDDLYATYVLQAQSSGFAPGVSFNILYDLQVYHSGAPITITRVKPFEEYKFVAPTDDTLTVLAFSLTQLVDYSQPQDYFIKAVDPANPNSYQSYDVTFGTLLTACTVPHHYYGDALITYANWQYTDIMFITIQPDTYSNVTFTVIPQRPFIREAEIGIDYTGNLQGFYYNNNDFSSMTDVEYFHFLIPAEQRGTSTISSYYLSISASFTFNYQIYTVTTSGANIGKWNSYRSGSSSYVYDQYDDCGGSEYIVALSARSGYNTNPTAYDYTFSVYGYQIDIVPLQLNVPYCQTIGDYGANYYAVPPVNDTSKPYRLHFSVRNDGAYQMDVYLSSGEPSSTNCLDNVLNISPDLLEDYVYLCGHAQNLTLSVSGVSGNSYVIWAAWEPVSVQDLTSGTTVTDRTIAYSDFSFDYWRLPLTGASLDTSMVVVQYSGGGDIILSQELVSEATCLQDEVSTVSISTYYLLFGCQLAMYMDQGMFFTVPSGQYELTVTLITANPTAISAGYDSLVKLSTIDTPSLYQLTVAPLDQLNDEFNIDIGTVRGASATFVILPSSTGGITCNSYQFTGDFAIQGLFDCGLLPDVYNIWVYSSALDCLGSNFRITAEYLNNPNNVAIATATLGQPTTLTGTIGVPQTVALPISGYTADTYLLLELRDVTNAPTPFKATGTFTTCPSDSPTTFSDDTIHFAPACMSDSPSYPDGTHLYVTVTVPQSTSTTTQLYGQASVTFTGSVNTFASITPGTPVSGTLSDYNNGYYFSAYQYKWTNATASAKSVELSITSGQIAYFAITSCSCQALIKPVVCTVGDACYFDTMQALDDFSHCTDIVLYVLGASAQYTLTLNVGKEQTCQPLTASTAPVCSAAFADGVGNMVGSTSGATFHMHDSVANADAYAHSKFLDLYEQVQCGFSSGGMCPCSPVSAQCNKTLMLLACSETFSACDDNGFATPICGGLCQNVYRDCGVMLSTIDGSASQQCSSAFYGLQTDKCTGCFNYDQCGNCNPVPGTQSVDRCGVCNGDGSTCPPSAASSLQATAAALVAFVVALALLF